MKLNTTQRLNGLFLAILFAYVSVNGYSAERIYRISSLKSRKCIDVRLNIAKEPGPNVQQWDCNNSDQQAWELHSVGNGHFKIVNRLSGFCLDANANAKNQNNVKMQTFQCSGAIQQTFKLIPSFFRNSYQIQLGFGDNMCIDLPHDNPINGTQLQQHSCSKWSQRDRHQLWIID